MSETPQNDGSPSTFDSQLGETLDGVRQRAEQALQNPPQVTDKHKAIALTLLGTYVLFRIEKRMVKKVVKKALATTPVRIDLSSYMADLDAWDKAQHAAYLAKHGLK